MTELTDPHIEIAIAAAREVRGRLGLESSEAFDRDLLACVEDDLGLLVCILELPDEVAGSYIRNGRRGHIFIKAADYPTRQRFTIAHELGHHMLGHGAVLESYSDVGRDTPNRREQQANYFASELLHPVEAVRLWLAANIDPPAAPQLEEVVRMAAHFHVSPPAMLYRLSKGDFPAVDRGVLDPLWKEVKADRHIEISEQLGIGHGDDTLSQIWEQGHWPRLPQGLATVDAEAITRDVRSVFSSAADDGEHARDDDTPADESAL